LQIRLGSKLLPQQSVVKFSDSARKVSLWLDLKGNIQAEKWGVQVMDASGKSQTITRSGGLGATFLKKTPYTSSSRLYYMGGTFTCIWAP
jgi:hypothetical protein